MNYRDVENLNNSITGLGDTLLRQRMLEQQRKDKAGERQLQERELGLREGEMRNQMSRQAAADKRAQDELDFEKDPNNPKNKEELSLAALHQKQMDALGVKTFKSSWTSGGRKIDLEGTKDEIAQAVKDNPPDQDEEQSIEFTTDNGVTIHQKGPAKALADLVQRYQGHIVQKPNPEKGPQVDVPLGAVDPNTGKPLGSLHGAANNPLIQEALRNYMGTNAPAFAAPQGATPLPLPKTKDQLVEGKVYKTARGNARWNGEQFLSVQ